MPKTKEPPRKRNSTRREKIKRLIEWCIINNLRPSSNMFFDKVSRFASKNFLVSMRTIKSYVKTMRDAYAVDRWDSFASNLKSNFHLTSHVDEKRSKDFKSLKSKVFEFWDLYPNVSYKELCQHLEIPYRSNRQTLYNYKREWEEKLDFGVVPRRVDHRGRWLTNVPDGLDRDGALSCGWVLTKNRNRELIFVDDAFGSLRWHVNGRVYLWLREGYNKKGCAAHLLCKGFAQLIGDDVVLQVCVDKLHYLGADSVFATEKKLPYVKIDDFKQSHGLEVVTGDGSHPNAVEIRHGYPDYLKPYVELFNQQCSLAVLDAWNSRKKGEFISTGYIA